MLCLFGEDMWYYISVFLPHFTENKATGALTIHYGSLGRALWENRDRSEQLFHDFHLTGLDNNLPLVGGGFRFGPSRICVSCVWKVRVSWHWHYVTQQGFLFPSAPQYRVWYECPLSNSPLWTTMETSNPFLSIVGAAKKVQEKINTRNRGTSARNRRSFSGIAAGSRLALRFVERSSDVLPPLKSAAAGLSFIIEAVEVCYECFNYFYWILTGILLFLDTEKTQQ